jgi:rubrerythrin
MSPRQAMEVALVSEEKAWSYFDDALGHVKDADVRKLFEELRAEEKQHQEYIKKAMATLPPGPDVEEDEADEPGSDAG